MRTMHQAQRSSPPWIRRARCAMGVCVTLSLACGPSPAPGDGGLDAATYALTIAAASSSGYAPLAPGAPIEMRLGFQGFRYTRVALVAGGSAPAVTQGRAWLEIDGFERSEQILSLVEFSRDDAGAMVSRPVLIFANDVVLANAVGRRGRIPITLEERGARTTATHEGVIQWDPNCVEDSEFRCRPSGADGGAE